MEYFDGERQVQKLILQKELCERCEGFGTEELLKTANDAGHLQMT